jgi:hypothetical protein
LKKIDDDDVDGCEIDFTEDPTPDDDLDYVVLFADVLGDEKAIEARADEYRALGI